MSIEIVRSETEACARQMAKDVGLDWVLLQDAWRDEYRKRATSALAAATKAQIDGYEFEWPDALLPLS